MQQLWFDQGTILKFADLNFTTKSPKILENISKFILIIADFNENDRMIMSIKQLPIEFFKSFAFSPEAMSFFYKFVPQKLTISMIFSELDFAERINGSRTTNKQTRYHITAVVLG